MVTGAARDIVSIPGMLTSIAPVVAISRSWALAGSRPSLPCSTLMAGYLIDTRPTDARLSHNPTVGRASIRSGLPCARSVSRMRKC